MAATITQNNTMIMPLNGATVCRLHSTNIVSLYPDHVILNSGGWETVTTKRRMNECFRAWELPFSVFQKDFIWYVDTPEGVIKFQDGMTIPL